MLKKSINSANTLGAIINAVQIRIFALTHSTILHIYNHDDPQNK